ncbi:IS3 family transposase [Clostridium sp. HBUAS56017]|uniref:IS3 family transposase n=1 Tax=Clostridium sp. HBUAS56017 TaxID=2571128 RepID=UPI00163D4614|nr:IS3 family transposase [Clostridium sp. HBUAS56017]
MSRSSYYAWDKRPESNRAKENEIILKKIKNIHNKSKKVYGSIKVGKELNDGKNPPINHKRIERIMSENGIRAKVAKKFKATTNSNYKLPVAENILNRDFSVEKPNEKMVRDITYVWTNE